MAIIQFTADVAKKLAIIMVPAALVLGTITVVRNTEWKDNSTLFRADSKKAPDNFKLAWFAGDQYMQLAKKDGTDAETRKQLIETAVTEYQRSIAIYPDYSAAQNSLSQAFIAIRRPDSAEVHCKAAIAGNPRDTTLIMNLANIYAGERKFPEATDLLKKLSSIDPGNPYYLFNVAASEIYSRQYDTAITYLRKSLAINPGFDRAVKMIAVLYHVTGQTDSAKKYEAVVQRSTPGFRVENVALPK